MLRVKSVMGKMERSFICFHFLMKPQRHKLDNNKILMGIFHKPRLSLQKIKINVCVCVCARARACLRACVRVHAHYTFTVLPKYFTTREKQTMVSHNYW